MAKASNSILAVVLGRDAVHLAEVRGRGASASVTRQSEMPWSITPDRLPGAAEGQLLKAHLEANGYQAKQAVVGLPASWVMARCWTLPPADDAALSGIIRLRVEKEFAGAPMPLAFDYTEAPAGADQRGVLLVGVRKDRLAAVHAMLNAAGVTPVSITATPLAVALHQVADGRVVLLEDSDTSVCGVSNGKPYALSRVSSRTAPQRWMPDVTRLLATVSPPEGSAAGAIQIGDLSGKLAPLTQAAAERWPDAATWQADAASVVGMHALSDAGPSINWVDDRLRPPKPKRLSPMMVWGIRAAVLLLLVALGVGYLWKSANDNLADLQAEYDAIADTSVRLERLHERTRNASGWFDTRPPIMDCMLELTRTFPKKGRIWVTNFAIDDENHGIVRCKAENKDTMLAYLKAMQASDSLSQIELRDWAESGRDVRTVVFEITFVYQPSGGDA